MKRLISLCLFVLMNSAWAKLETFYPQDFAYQIQSGKLKDLALKNSLLAIISYPHHALGYDKARQILFGKLYLEQDARGYFLRDTYCHKEFRGPHIGPFLIPDHNEINVEHTWPQSKYGARDEKYKVCDLHHLFMADNTGNKARANNPFAETTQGSSAAPDCPDSQIEKVPTLNGKISFVFEPPQEHKGNVARALFYFAIRYKLSLDPAQEKTMRLWNKLDPVDAKERENNEIIEEFQGNRNPFIDFPELSDSIADF